MDLEVKERMRRFFFSKKNVVSEKQVRAVHRPRNQIGVALSSFWGGSAHLSQKPL